METKKYDKETRASKPIGPLQRSDCHRIAVQHGRPNRPRRCREWNRPIVFTVIGPELKITYHVSYHGSQWTITSDQACPGRAVLLHLTIIAMAAE